MRRRGGPVKYVDLTPDHLGDDGRRRDERTAVLVLGVFACGLLGGLTIILLDLLAGLLAP